MIRIIRFIIGTLPGQYPAGTYLQDSMFNNTRVESVELNGQPLLLTSYAHNPADWRLNFSSGFSNGDEVLVFITLL